MSFLKKIKGLFGSKPKAEIEKPKAAKAAKAVKAEKPAAAEKRPAPKKPVVAAKPKHSEERLTQVLRSPHVSEKSVQMAEREQHAFEVRKDATRDEVKAAVELLLKVQVREVRMINVRGKQKRNGRRSDWRKAYVRLMPGQALDSGEAGA